MFWEISSRFTRPTYILCTEQLARNLGKGLFYRSKNSQSRALCSVKEWREKNFWLYQLQDKRLYRRVFVSSDWGGHGRVHGARLESNEGLAGHGPRAPYWPEEGKQNIIGSPLTERFSDRVKPLRTSFNVTRKTLGFFSFPNLCAPGEGHLRVSVQFESLAATMPLANARSGVTFVGQ
jgi:hypothetical protein